MASTIVIDKAAPTRKVNYGSISRDRTWALRWSYFFLTLFVIFSLVPPLYMLITSLKGSAAISAATNPWWVFHPTLSNYVELLTSNQYLIFFRNSAFVSVFVVTITMLISVPAAFALSRMRFWGSATLATGIFLTYLVPDTLLFLPLFKMFVVFHDWTGIQLINKWYVLLIVYPTLTVPFCTWIMIGYFASIPKELDEAAIIDGASWFQTLTRIFIPVALMQGIVGKFMSSFGFTAAFAIMVSLLVSFTLTPMLCSRFLRIKKHGPTKDSVMFRAVDRPYSAMLQWSMAHRWVIVAVALIIIVSIVPLFMMVGKVFIPVDDQSEFEVSVRMPPGSSLGGTDSVMRDIQAELRKLPGIKNLLLTIGSDINRQVDRGSLLVELVPMGARTQGQTAIMDMARQRLARFHGLVIAVSPPPVIQGFGQAWDLQFYIQGPDLNKLDFYAHEIMKKLGGMPGVVDLDTSYESGKPEVRILIKRDQASDLGVNVDSIANGMRTLVAGDSQVTYYREGDDRGADGDGSAISNSVLMRSPNENCSGRGWTSINIK